MFVMADSAINIYGGFKMAYKFQIGAATLSGSINVADGAISGSAVSDTLASAIISEIDAGEIPIAKLAADATISGKSLGGTLDSLTDGNGITDFTYNGSGAVAISVQLNGSSLSNAAAGLSLNSVYVASDGLEDDSGKLRVSLSGSASGLNRDSGGIKVALSSSGGLEALNDGLKVKVKAASGIDLDADGLQLDDAYLRGKVSATDAGGDGSFAYNNTTGVFTYTGPSAAEARAHVSVTDAGGDGSLAYAPGTGIFTYTGPSAAEVRAHVSAGTGVAVSNGQFSIGQAVATSDSVTFQTGSFQGDVVITGDLTVNGDTVTLNTTELEVEDSKIRIGKNAVNLAGSTGYGFEIGNNYASLVVGNGSDVNTAFVSSLEIKASRFIGDMEGSLAESVQTISADATLDLDNGTIVLINAAGGDVTLTLPASAGKSGKVIKIKRIDSATANSVTLDGNASETMDGAATVALDSAFAGLSLISNGANWFIL